MAYKAMLMISIEINNVLTNRERERERERVRERKRQEEILGEERTLTHTLE